MRELKFRAWLVGNKKYDWHPIIDNGKLCTIDGNEIYGYEDENTYILEQYTSLKDKNGKEIYEGDIVKADGRIYEVVWFEKDGGWFCFRENDSVYTPLYHLKSEVIGNIHENPELIKEKEYEEKYTLADFVKGRVDDETLDRIALKADGLQRENLSEGYEVGEIPPEQLEKQKKRYAKDISILSKEDKAVVDKAAKLIARDYSETLRELADE